MESSFHKGSQVTENLKALIWQLESQEENVGSENGRGMARFQRMSH